MSHLKDHKENPRLAAAIKAIQTLECAVSHAEVCLGGAIVGLRSCAAILTLPLIY